MISFSTIKKMAIGSVATGLALVTGFTGVSADTTFPEATVSPVPSVSVLDNTLDFISDVSEVVITVATLDNGTLTLSGASLSNLEGTFDNIGQSALDMLIQVITAGKSLIILGFAVMFIMMFVRRR